MEEIAKELAKTIVDTREIAPELFAMLSRYYLNDAVVTVLFATAFFFTLIWFDLRIYRKLRDIKGDIMELVDAEPILFLVGFAMFMATVLMFVIFITKVPSSIVTIIDPQAVTLRHLVR